MSDLTFYTAAEVAEMLRLNHQVVLRKLQAGEIPGYKIGKEWRIEKGRLLGWLAFKDALAQGVEAKETAS